MHPYAGRELCSKEFRAIIVRLKLLAKGAAGLSDRGNPFIDQVPLETECFVRWVNVAWKSEVMGKINGNFQDLADTFDLYKLPRFLTFEGAAHAIMDTLEKVPLEHRQGKWAKEFDRTKNDILVNDRKNILLNLKRMPDVTLSDADMRDIESQVESLPQKYRMSAEQWRELLDEHDDHSACGRPLHSDSKVCRLYDKIVQIEKEKDDKRIDKKRPVESLQRGS